MKLSREIKGKKKKVMCGLGRDELYEAQFLNDPRRVAAGEGGEASSAVTVWHGTPSLTQRGGLYRLGDRRRKWRRCLKGMDAQKVFLIDKSKKERVVPLQRRVTVVKRDGHLTGLVRRSVTQNQHLSSPNDSRAEERMGKVERSVGPPSLT